MVHARLGPSTGADWLVCGRVRSRLQHLDGVLGTVVKDADPRLDEMVGHLIRQRGKRLRPAVMLLAAEFGRADEAPLLDAGAGLELLHVASLYHDDVMDRAKVRRGVETVNARWGNAAATAAGSYLFATASRLFSSLGDRPNQFAGEASADVCTGQLQELENAFNLELSESDHLEILARKTATLFELPCLLGGHLAQVPTGILQALRSYGRHLGVAFQLADDALDVAGDSALLGKAAKTDVHQGVYSLAVLRTLRKTPASAQIRALLGKSRPTGADARAVLGIVRESGAVEEALEVARGYSMRAQAALAVLPPGTARRSLYNLASYVTRRSS